MNPIKTFIKIVKKEGLKKHIKYILSWNKFNFQIKIHNIKYQLLSKITKKQLIWVIGDSHTQAFRYEKYFIIKYLGPATAFNLINKNNSTKSFERTSKIIKNISKKHFAIFSFGEIDCRSQIYNLSKKHKKSKNDLIKKTINNYELAINYFLKKHKKIMIYSMAPAEKKRRSIQ